ILTELAIPLHVGRVVVGVLNIESKRALPDGAEHLIRPLASALVPLAEDVCAGGALELPALARLFVHFGSIRDPDEIAALAAASLPRMLPLEVSQVVVWNELGSPVELASWSRDATTQLPLTSAELEATRAQADPTGVCEVFDLEGSLGRQSGAGPVVWLPLRANGAELGALVARGRAGERVDPVQLDGAALLAAHVAASLDTATSLRRERQTAVTDMLTGILNRRGLEERLDHELAVAQERRLPVSLLVIDCDDFKEINDRAGHEFGDALLHEIARVLVQVLPDGAEPARLGGDEFVVMLPGAGADAAEALGGRIRSVLADGLTDAGFPLRISAGISTYPFDGASQARSCGPPIRRCTRQKMGERIESRRFGTSFAVDRPRSQRRAGPPSTTPHVAVEAKDRFLPMWWLLPRRSKPRRRSRAFAGRLCKSLVFVVGATACSASRVVGDYLVDATEHALREVWLGDAAAYRIADFPLTAETLRTSQPRAVSFVHGDVDPAEAFILRELGMNALLMLPLQVGGRPWGLVELYEMRLRQFTEDDVAIAQFLTAQAERQLDVVGAGSTPVLQPPVYELPPDDATR
nr:diguanylate cyclase [Actinomycetota bacterium]